MLLNLAEKQDAAMRMEALSHLVNGNLGDYDEKAAEKLAVIFKDANIDSQYRVQAIEYYSSLDISDDKKAEALLANVNDASTDIKIQTLAALAKIAGQELKVQILPPVCEGFRECDITEGYLKVFVSTLSSEDIVFKEEVLAGFIDILNASRNLDMIESVMDMLKVRSIPYFIEVFDSLSEDKKPAGIKKSI